MAIHRPEKLAFTHSLAYVYLYMAHHGDSEGLTPDELGRIVEKVREWNDQFSPDVRASLETTVKEVKEAWSYFCDLTSEEEDSELAAHVLALRNFLPSDSHRRAVVADLIAIAQADGRVTDREKAYIGVVQRALGLG